MTQKMLLLSGGFVTDHHRALAQLKYNVKHLESRLKRLLEADNELEACCDEIIEICNSLAHEYMNYCKLISLDNKKNNSLFKVSDKVRNGSEIYSHILELKQQLSKTVDMTQEKKLIAEIASLYYQFKKSMTYPKSSGNQEHFRDLKELFKMANHKSWLSILVDYWNQSDTPNQDVHLLFHDWSLPDLQLALNFFADSKLVDLVNAIFFYKLYPDKLFNELIHPEKLVSVRMRMEVLHHYLELLQHHLYSIAALHELKPKIDYFFHGDELPQGIMIEVNEDFREMIQSAIKQFKIKLTVENEQQEILNQLHDFERAYKFWFNPNRLIDAVMVLQQRLGKWTQDEKNNSSVFHQEMVVLYAQLTTTECLDLYGYFANNDSRYLLYTLSSIGNGHALDWLPSISPAERKAIDSVFNALKCVIEALRVELKNRHINPEPYAYDFPTEKNKPIGRRNRDAVFRIMAIYGRELIATSDVVEKLFSSIENSNEESTKL